MKDDNHFELNDRGSRNPKFGPMQALYVAYSLFYMRTSFYRGGFLADIIDDKGLGIMGIVGLIFMAIVLIYNHKYERRKAVKVTCYMMIMPLMVGIGNYLIQVL